MSYLFWDFLSLMQLPRSPPEESSFQAALENMHLIYGHCLWRVFRFVTSQDDATNNTPYIQRGWCVFESMVATVLSKQLVSVKDGLVDYGVKSPVPLSPTKFTEEVSNLHFPSPEEEDDPQRDHTHTQAI